MGNSPQKKLWRGFLLDYFNTCVGFNKANKDVPGPIRKQKLVAHLRLWITTQSGRLRYLFEHYDKDQDGILSLEDLRELLRDMCKVCAEVVPDFVCKQLSKVGRDAFQLGYLAWRKFLKYTAAEARSIYAYQAVDVERGKVADAVHFELTDGRSKKEFEKETKALVLQVVNALHDLQAVPGDLRYLIAQYYTNVDVVMADNFVFNFVRAFSPNLDILKSMAQACETASQKLREEGLTP